MLRIHQFRYGSDNFSYVIHGKEKAISIDPGAVKAICDYLESNKLRLTHVTNTHMHPDHTSGNREILSRTKSTFIDNETLHHMNSIPLENSAVEILHTPGHTEDSFTFHAADTLITGDTLFNGTVGNCFSGDTKAFFHSVKKILQFPTQTVIYAGHDYVREAMIFAKTIEPENPAIDHFLKQYNPSHVYSTLADELRVNPYLRFNDNALITILKAKGLPIETEFDRWNTLMNYY